MKATFTRTNYNYRPLDQRPVPDYEVFGMKDLIDNYSMATRVLYRYPRPYPRPFVLVASRSCPFSCTFCTHGHDRAPYRARSIESIMAEIKESYEKYRFNILIILDELFAVSKGRLKEFSEAVLQGRHDFGWDFDWCFQTHASAKLDQDVLGLAKTAGCYNFSYGLESASPTVLKSMGKRIRPDQVAEAIKLAEDVGLDFSGNLIFGDPAETEQTIYESLEFFFRYCSRVCVFLSQVQPYPGSQIFDDALVKGIIPDKRQYYETIGERNYNLTTMSTETLIHWMHIINWLEHSWAWVRTTKGKMTDELGYSDRLTQYFGVKMRQVRATCPYCGKETLDREMIGGAKAGTFIGRACKHCGRRVKIKLEV